MAEDIFNDDGVTPTGENHLEQFVGEGKKFKSVEELAKAYANADHHIGELRTDLQSTREFISEELKKLAEQRKQEPPKTPVLETGSTPNPAPVTPSSETVEDLDTRIAKALESRDTLTRLQNNASLVQDVLVEQLGSVEKAAEAVVNKARELGLAPTDMKELAAKSPKAFLATMGIDADVKPQSTSTPAPRSDVNPQNINSGAPKANTYAYFEQIRKSDPKLYWNTKTQKAMHDAAQAMGEDFFN
jgi:hypothetical protein